MWRRNCLWGWRLIFLGLGILLGYWVESWFWCFFVSVGLIGLGFSLLRRK